MNKEEYKELLEDFRSMCPWAAKTVKRYWISGHMEITAELKDGSAIKYDGVLRAFRWAENLEELAAISRPRNEAEWKQQFCLRLWHVMLSKGMTQQDLSVDTGISIGSINQYINGNVVPNAYNAIKIAKALGCTAEEFVNLVCYD